MSVFSRVWSQATAPVTQCGSDLQAALDQGVPILVSAAPGSGKTTLVPLFVREFLDTRTAGTRTGRVLVAQPRRVAVTAAARYVARLCGQRVGDLVGLSMRGERRVSAGTRVEFTTTGSLLRRLLADPDLLGVDAVILDEVHERHLDADLVLAFLRDLLLLRDDLTVIAMSATADATALEAVFGTVQVVGVPTPTFPLTQRWVPCRGASVERERMSAALASHLLEVVDLAFRRHGPTLVFVPAIADVEELVARLRERHLPAVPLHSAVDGQAQRRALAGGDQIVVATDIAQTSLTIDGVFCVVDSCLSRQPRFDVARDTPRLVTVRASRAAMVQRAGRAHRQGEGVVYRCMEAAEWARVGEFDPPQSQHADLTAAVLAAYSWSSVGELVLPSAFPAGAVARAEQACAELGALEPASGSISAWRVSDSGRLLALLPTDPRLAHALLAATYLLPQRWHERVAQTVALLSSEVRLDDPDISQVSAQGRVGEKEHLAEYAQRWAGAYGECLPPALRSLEVVDISSEDVPGLVIALAFPRWVARRSYSGVHLSVGAGALRTPVTSSLADDEWLAAASIQRVGANTWVRAGAALRPEWVDGVCWVHRRTSVEILLQGNALVGFEGVCWGEIAGPRLKLPVPLPPRVESLAWEALVERAWAVGLQMFDPSPAVAQLVERLRFLSAQADTALGEQIRQAGVDAEALRLAALTPQVVAQHLPTLVGQSWADLLAGRPLSEVDLRAGLYALLGWELLGWLDSNWVCEVVLPSGRAVPVGLDPQRGPTVRAKLQECFGWRQLPSVLGRVVTVELLSPAGRPLAITSDLVSFFDQVYPQVRADMRGRYPKHPWPEDPWQAPATALSKAALARRQESH